MGKKSIGSKALNRDQRFRLIKMKMEKLSENKGEVNVTTAKVICKSCGFNARYQFIRCPECSSEQK